MSGERKGPRNRGSESAISRLRLAAGLTQEQLAQQVGCQRLQVARWEHGVTPSATSLAKVARALGCAMEDLLGGSQGGSHGDEP